MKKTARERAIERDANSILTHFAEFFTINANGEKLFAIASNVAGKNYDRNYRNYQRSKRKAK